MSKKKVYSDILEYLQQNLDVLNECISDLSLYNGYAEYEGLWMSMDVLDTILANKTPTDIILMARLGKDFDGEKMKDSRGETKYPAFNPNRDFFRLNALDHLESTNEPDWSHLCDDDLVEELAENRAYVWALNRDDTLCELFDELES